MAKKFVLNTSMYELAGGFVEQKSAQFDGFRGLRIVLSRAVKKPGPAHLFPNAR